MLSVEASGKHYITGLVWKVASQYGAGAFPRASRYKNSMSVITHALENEISILNRRGSFDEAEQKDLLLLLLEDPQFSYELIERLKVENGSISSSIKEAFLVAGGKYEAIGSIVQTADLEGLSNLIESALCMPETGDVEASASYVLVVRSLSSRMLRLIDSDLLVAVVCEQDNTSSHVAIFLRTLGIPTVFGISGAFDKLGDGDRIYIDSYTQRIFTSAHEWHYDIEKGTLATSPVLTRDNEPVKLQCTVNFASEAQNISLYTFEGIGLVRTEFLFSRTNSEPSHFRQKTVYSSIQDWAMADNIKFRLFDYGSGKEISWINHAKRLEIYERQIGAIVASCPDGTLDILAPKCEDASELVALRKMIEEAKERTGSTAHFRLGAMIETIESLSSLGEIIALSDFINIGTNDLSSESAGVAREDADEGTVFIEPAFLQNLLTVLATLGKYGIEATICGEMMRSKEHMYILIGMGARQFSVPAKKIPQVSEFISKINAREASRNIWNIINLKTVEEVSGALLDLNI
ncbi:MAG: PEP-utilizing enzyme [Eubacteriaceae bacterium]|nr:PEP-utilizing enzyme [Eubacteriaceae bacterium]